ncbi:hypothetical protein TI39_contig4329g00003 [Zymoseptoria brevis]|uniref:Uncharacterized protein n=1 Tax=Zymoseptoria brevis TaxID=1047168 RepID=A0A0F4G7L0_9PEZI|nr:hypothetical protein TI39_contig4329g00003 [Zymoseptoria brevis]
MLYFTSTIRPAAITPLLILVGHAFAQTTSSSENARLFIQNIDPNAGWAASIQNACNGSTTYVISCTSAPINNECSPRTATMTEGNDFYIATTPAIYSETSATITQSCALDKAALSASCVAEIAAGGYGNDIRSTVSYNLTGNDYYQYDVKVTKGAERTAGGGACVKESGALQSQGKTEGTRSRAMAWMSTILVSGLMTLSML